MDEQNFMAEIEPTLQQISEMVPQEQLLASARAITDALISALDFDRDMLMNSIQPALEEISELMRTQTQDMAQNLTAPLLEAFRFVPPDVLVSADEAKTLVEEVKPYLPLEAAAAIDEKVTNAQTANAKVPWSKIKEIILFVVAIWSLLLQLNPDPQTEIQTEMLELQRQEAERSEEFRQRTEEHFEIVEDAQERIAQAVEMLVDCFVETDDESYSVTDPVDSQNISEDCDALQDQSNRQP